MEISNYPLVVLNKLVKEVNVCSFSNTVIFVVFDGQKDILHN